MERTTGIEPVLPAWESKFSILYFHNLQNRSALAIDPLDFARPTTREELLEKLIVKTGVLKRKRRLGSVAM
jgi:hypothetical protein